ncbi:hypothetical protein ES703_112910 [subsurface metagenome]
MIILFNLLRRRRLATQLISPAEPVSVPDATLIDSTPTVMAPGIPQVPPTTPTPVPLPASIPAPGPTKPDAAQHTLIVKINGEGTTDPAEGSHQFKDGTIIELSARSSKKWKFVGWVGDVDHPYQHFTAITMDTDKIITATFQELQLATPTPALESTKPDTTTQCMLTIKINGEGTTVPAEGTHQFRARTDIYATAIASDGWRFIGWVGDVDEPYLEGTALTMDVGKTITATFQKLQYHA